MDYGYSLNDMKCYDDLAYNMVRLTTQRVDPAQVIKFTTDTHACIFRVRSSPL